MDEQRWIRQIQKKASESAADALVSKYYKEMYAFHYKQTMNVELSLDLTQELFIGALQAIRNYDSSKASFRTWLYKLASNRLVDYYRSKSYRYAQLSQPLGDYEVEDTHDVSISLEYKEDVEQVIGIVNSLDAKLQQVIRLKLFGDYTLPEIADMESIPLSTVKTRYYAALKFIRKEMEAVHDA
ncbi:RNA polymerase sigma factor [Sporosarcina cyprini]|uniref:RNA polymerase sigma factor n=1 Tax=Sporosarcina cyprini TaxID=2910523 RepID=UPI001EDF7E82|nr:sigma-70 family RNA polymerase sigma factor [Sporosarcina cyprini]MCG3089518.1 sigma-70 family RNA polymerase sigma factor [Sporosarcina cyprini]